MRLDPSRSFYYRTTRKPVYTLVDKAEMEEPNDRLESEPEDCNSDLLVSDHQFDRPERISIQGKKKYATLSTGRNAVKRGSLGVRWEGARRNESKLLPTVRMGIDLV
ncbi:uncharacterized protein LOC123561958 [Mercenaria mercenaria]|uniref:uncharacterized protein LOC123561958 n=1 Tax=Mercenaria mercenaria TaxID=6596 RepID=UPI00234EF3CC|nr:uncharacterized protein LOC123561958 [Mercenaria mercenaria]